MGRLFFRHFEIFKCKWRRSLFLFFENAHAKDRAAKVYSKKCIQYMPEAQHWLSFLVNCGITKSFLLCRTCSLKQHQSNHSQPAFKPTAAEAQKRIPWSRWRVIVDPKSSCVEMMKKRICRRATQFTICTATEKCGYF